MDLVSISIAIFFLVIAYVTFCRFMKDPERLDEVQMVDSTSSTPSTPPEVSATLASNSDAIPDAKVKEVVYTQDYYPWWRSTRWWNYDGWLYQKPYYNYFRRP